MNASSISSDELKQFIVSDEFSDIVQSTQSSYKKKWEKWARNKEKISLNTTISWNWAAFFFQELWLLYRKVYNLFWIFLGVRIAITCFTLFIMSDFMNYVTEKIILVLPVVIGILGNGWYLKKCILLNQEAGLQFKNASVNVDIKDKKKVYLKNNGGTSLKWVLLYILLGIIFTGSISFAVWEEVKVYV